MIEDGFERRAQTLFCESINLEHLASTHGTPLYVYSRRAIERAYMRYETALAARRHLICYAVKANSNLAVLNCLARLGAGFDIVSGGELERVIAAGGEPSKIVFSGVCKSPEDMRQALTAGIRCFNVESAAELHQLSAIACEENKIAPISLRVNPDVDARTHPYISTGLKDNKFGIDIALAPELYRQALLLEGVHPIGIDCHIGSQLQSIGPFTDALERLLVLIEALEQEGITLEHLDLGGGLGVAYGNEAMPSVKDYIDALTAKLTGRDIALIFEPGRSIVAMAGIMLTRVNSLKSTQDKHFALVDAAMNDLIRPALYSAWQDIVPVTQRGGESRRWDVVGPVCETGDFLGKDRQLILSPGDLLAVTGAGAYGFVMASNYNSRPRPAEIMVDNDTAHVVRTRETRSQLWAGEQCLPEAIQ